MKEEVQKVRVAAVQFGSTNSVEENLATTLRMIDEAAIVYPDLMVLPEFSNHNSWYDDKDHCFQVSVPLDGEFLQAIADKAKEYQCYIVINCTVQRENGTCTGTSLTYNPQGKLVLESDKQVLMGHENDYLEKAQIITPIIETPIGRIGTYACMDGVINETPRSLGLRGAQILCNSLNSFALDEASLHIPVRAPENRVFIIAANKVGPLIPADQVEPVAAATSIPAKHLDGAGESQIVAPDGTVLAKAPLQGEAVIYADIDVSTADNKLRPDGTDVFSARRPELYQAIGVKPQDTNHPVAAESIQSAVYQPKHDGIKSIDECAEVIKTSAQSGTQLIVLPELFCFENGIVNDPGEGIKRSKSAVDKIAIALQNTSTYVVTSIIDKTETGYAHSGVMISSAGIVLSQHQLHTVNRHSAWATSLGDALNTYATSWGKFAIVVGDDSIYPESFRLAALQQVDVVAVPMDVQEKWEVTTGLIERASENRICTVTATRPKEIGTSLLMTLHNDFTIMTKWDTRPFDGNISHAIVQRAENAPGLTNATLHPAATQNKVVSRNTHLIDNRPWHLAEAITGNTR